LLPITDFRVVHKNYIFSANAVGLGSTWNSLGKIKIRLLITFSFLLITLFATQLVFATNLATDGEKLAQMEREIQTKQSENANLKTEIARQSSLTSLQERAKTLGFSSNPKIINP